jgi:serine/threonine protein kinase
MEYLSGRNLEQCLQADGALSPALTCEIARQVGLGLSKAHALGLVHRDLKPENIFLIDDDALLVKLLDFGVVKTLDPPLELKTVSGTIVGTPHYMSPEQATDAEVDGRSDLWSLAVVIFRCLTGRLPFDGQSLPQVLLNVLYEPVPMPSDHNPGLPRALDAWWARAVSRDPALRFQTAIEFVRELERACGVPSRYSTPAPIEQLARTRSSSVRSGLIVRQLLAAGRHRVTLMALLTAALLLGGAYWFAARHAASSPLAEVEAEDAAIPGMPTPETEPGLSVALNLATKASKTREPGTRAPERTSVAPRSSGTQLDPAHPSRRVPEVNDERWGF